MMQEFVQKQFAKTSDAKRSMPNFASYNFAAYRSSTVLEAVPYFFFLDKSPWTFIKYLLNGRNIGSQFEALLLEYRILSIRILQGFI